MAEHMQDWRLYWEPILMQSIPTWSHKYKERRRGEVPYRICPHGKYHFDEKIAPPDVLNCFMVVPERCKHHRCRRAVKRNLRNP